MARCKYTRTQWLTLVIFGLADFCAALCVSLQAPFYPNEAEKKGATATQYGLVFGIFELTVFLVSPIYGRYLNRVGPKLVFNLGIFTTASCCILFGLLDRINGTTTFIALSFVVRIVEALGNAGFLTAAFSIIAKEFPESVATTFASLEMMFGLGLIVGPTVGGFLYQVGGYSLPFIVLGSTLIVTAILTLLFLPKHNDHEHTCSNQESVWKAVTTPSFAIGAYSIVCASSSLGFIQALLEPHLRRFALTPVVLGLVFIINGVMYALSAPVWGWLCDHYVRPKAVSFVSAILVVIGFVMVGPAPFIRAEPTVSLVCWALVIHGLGFGGEVVAGFADLHREAIRIGFPDNIETYGVVSGMWTSMFALGAFIGPSIAGSLYDHFGFSYATLLIIIANVLLAFLVSWFLRDGIGRVPVHGRSSLQDLEEQPLVKTSFDSTYGSAGSDQNS